MAVSLKEEIEALQRQLDELARDPDDNLIKRYTLRWPPLPPGLYWQLRWLISLSLRGLESMRILRSDPWPTSLKQGCANAKAKPLLIWAVGADREKLREACDGLSRLRDSLPGFAPVLVTDVGDFAYFSRLGWLVEYLPRVAGQGEPYEERKLKYLARLYRGAPVLPVSAGLEDGRESEYLQWLASNS